MPKRARVDSTTAGSSWAEESLSEYAETAAAVKLALLGDWQRFLQQARVNTEILPAVVVRLAHKVARLLDHLRR